MASAAGDIEHKRVVALDVNGRLASGVEPKDFATIAQPPKNIREELP
jgi:hypothetical protein